MLEKSKGRESLQLGQSVRPEIAWTWTASASGWRGLAYPNPIRQRQDIGMDHWIMVHGRMQTRTVVSPFCTSPHINAATRNEPQKSSCRRIRRRAEEEELCAVIILNLSTSPSLSRGFSLLAATSNTFRQRPGRQASAAMVC